jgi:hypothetical protein
VYVLVFVGAMFKCAYAAINALLCQRSHTMIKYGYDIVVPVLVAVSRHSKNRLITITNTYKNVLQW